MSFLAVLVSNINYALDGAEVSGTKNGDDVGTSFVERLSFIEASVHGLQVNQDFVVWELGTKGFEQLDTIVLDAWGTNFKNVHVWSYFASQCNGCVKIQ